MKTRKHHLRKTHNKSNKTIDRILLVVIMFIATGLRLSVLLQRPFQIEESFSLWVEVLVALLSIGTIYLIYLIGQQWFNRKVGLFSAAFFAVSQFTVFYNQLALPYSAGLFFVLLMVWLWYKVVFETKTPTIGVYTGFAFSACACSLMQYFSMAQAGLIFLTGLLFLPKERRKAYWLSVTSALLFSAAMLLVFCNYFPFGRNITTGPSILSIKYIIDVLQYTMNNSHLFIFVMGIVIILPFILGKRDKSRNPLRWVGIVWFVIIFGATFAYSLFHGPILQNNILIFSYPFLIIVAFSAFKNRTLSPWQNALVVAAILFAGVSSFFLDLRY